MEEQWQTESSSAGLVQAPEHPNPRSAFVARAVKVWTGQLVDLSARNNLLFFRDLRAGTLDLGSIERDKLAGLLAGRTYALSKLFTDPDRWPDVQKRGRAIRNRFQELYEER